MKLSIIVPIYNAELYLDECIKSILNQSYKVLEIILVNDGSTDNSLKICQHFAQKDKRIKILTQNNGGQSSARNLGLDNATGDFITFIDSDDTISSDLYKKNMELMQADSSIDVIQFPYYQYYGLDIGYLKKIKPKRITLREEFYKGLLITENISWVVWDKIYRKDIFKNLRFVEKMYYEDNYIIFQIMSIINCLSLSNEEIYYYHARPNSLSNAPNSKKRELNSLKVNYLVYNEIIKYSKLKLELILIQNRIVNVATSLFKNFNSTPLKYIPKNFSKKEINIKSLIDIRLPLPLSQRIKMFIIKMIGFKLFFKIAKFI
jgi:glycosyltransferase involved in cell wall biosynthesis